MASGSHPARRWRVGAAAAFVLMLVLTGGIWYVRSVSAPFAPRSGQLPHPRRTEPRTAPAPRTLRASPSDSAAPSDPVQPLQVRLADLASGMTIAPADVQVGQPGTTQRLVTLSSGESRIACAADELATLRLVTPPGTIAGATTESGGSSASAWSWKPTTARVRVEYESDAPADRVAAATIDCVFLGSIGARMDRPDVDPFTYEWLSAHGVKSDGAVPAADGEEVALRMPRVRGFAIRARAAGWLTAVARLPDPAPDGDWRVTLTLRRSQLLTGRVVGPDGRPVAGADVRCHVSWSTAFDAVPRDALRALGGGVAARYSQKEGRSYFTNVRGCTARADGSFTASANQVGDVLVAVFAPGYKPGWFRAPPGDGDRSTGDIVLVPDEGPRVRIVCSGTVVPSGATVRIADISVGEAQPTCPELSTDEDGTIPGGWLEVGHAYAIVVKHPGLARRVLFGQLLWDGRRELDADKLEPHVELIRRN